MRLNADARIYLGLLAIALFMVAWSLLAMDYRLESKMMPVVIGSLVAFLAALGLAKELRARRRPAAPSHDESDLAQETWGGYVVNVGWLLGFLLAIYLLGYLMAIPLFVVLYTKRLGSGFLAAIVSAVIVAAFIYGAFELALEVKLYRGLLFS
jgi:hypothetical protein